MNVAKGNFYRQEDRRVRIVDKYIFPPFIALFFLLIGGAGILVADIIVGLSAGGLAESWPEIFTRPSVIEDPEGYERYDMIIDLAAVILTLIPTTYLSMRLDNKRFEYIVVLTEGLYSVPERLGWYLRTFWLTELISATAAPLLLTLPVYLIPEKYIHGILPALWCGGRLEPYFSIFPGTLIILAAAIVIRLCFIPSVLRGWRVSWLTGSIG